jgi:hypothetical protein
MYKQRNGRDCSMEHVKEIERMHPSSKSSDVSPTDTCRDIILTRVAGAPFIRLSNSSFTVIISFNAV